MIDLTKMPNEIDICCKMDTEIILTVRRGANSTGDKELYYVSYEDGALSRVDTQGVIQFNPYEKTETRIIELYPRNKFPEYYL